MTLPGVPRMGGNGHSWGLDGFSASSLPEPVAAPFFGARAFTVRTFGTMPPGVILGGSVVPYKNRRGHIIGGLHSIFMEQYRWGNGTNRAVCLRAGSASASRQHLNGIMRQNCGCGFWAYCGDGKHTRPAHNDIIWAVIQGWGRMIVGPKGFRAQRARIVALTFPIVSKERPFETQLQRWRFNSGRYPDGIEHVTDQEQITAAIRKAYPAPAWFDSVDAMLAEFPLTNLAPLLPTQSSESEAS